MHFSIGIDELNKLLPELLYPGSMVVVAGHPGSGKTTLASTICYSNALRGHRCLYVSFQETREKLYRVMKNLGIDFYELEKKGLYVFIRIPIMKNVEEAVESINRAISSWNPKIVVIDSINTLLQVVESPDRRAWLQNYFYAIPDIIKGIAILVAELPMDIERVEIGSIEFVADVVLILKHRIERGLLTRYIEIRKARGVPVTLAEIPYTILTDKGIKVFVPPILSEVGRPGVELEPPCRSLKEVLDHIHMGHSIYIEYPADLRAVEAAPLILGIAFRNKLKTLIISYLYSPETMTELLLRVFKRFCSDVDKVRTILQKNVILKSMNPYAYSISEGLAKEYSLINEATADVIVFHSVEIPAIIEYRDPVYISSLYNQVNILKQKHKIVVRIASKINDELSNIFSVLSDIVMKFIPTENKQNYRLYIWRRGMRSFVLDNNEVNECLEEISKHLCIMDETS
ncbi:MAG: ATPase domain-containing protein [Ignisphaera sp.]